MPVFPLEFPYKVTIICSTKQKNYWSLFFYDHFLSSHATSLPFSEKGQQQLPWCAPSSACADRPASCCQRREESTNESCPFCHWGTSEIPVPYPATNNYTFHKAQLLCNPDLLLQMGWQTLVAEGRKCAGPKEWSSFPSQTRLGMKRDQERR